MPILTEPLHLHSKHTQLSLFEDEQGQIRVAYFGTRLHDESDAMSMGCDQAPLLYSTYADSFSTPRNASGEYDLCIIQADGQISLALVHKHYEKHSLDKDRHEHIFTLKDPAYPVKIEIHLCVYEQSDTFVQWVSIHNESNTGIQLLRASSGHLYAKANHYFITGFRGTWGGESLMCETELALGHEIDFCSDTGTKAAQEGTPGIIIALNEPASETKGEVILGSLAWSGNYRLWCKHNQHHYLYAGVGLDITPAPYQLDAHSQFETPKMIWVYSDAGKGEASRRLHRWARQYGIRHGQKERYVLLNSWEGVYFNFNEETLYRMMERTAEMGIELFVLDDGWFGNKFPRNHDKAGLGDWEINHTKLPDGIRGLTEKAKALGIRFGIWLEPEMVNPESCLYQSHPDWAIQLNHREPKRERHQLVLDLSNPAVRGYIINVFRDLLTSNPDIDYIKWDCNRKISDPGSTYLDACHQGNLAIDYVRGYEEILRGITAEFPHVTIQACSAGGGRIDYGTLKHYHEFWTSDNTDAVERVYMQWSVSHFFPAIAMAAHVTASPNHQTGRSTPLKFRFDVAMSGRLGFELQPCDMNDDEVNYAKQALSEYKRIRPIIQFGDLYRLSNPWKNRVAAHMFVHGKRAILFAYLMDKWLADWPPKLKLQGLNPQARYRLTELNVDDSGFRTESHQRIVGGDYLMNSGLLIHWRRPLQSLCLELEETD